MRAAFNDTASVYFGPGTATPGALRFTVACRLVPQNRIFDNFPGFSPPFFYATYIGPPSSAGLVTPTATGYDANTEHADLWEFASLPGVTFICYDKDGVTPLTGSPYRRVFLALP